MAREARRRALDRRIDAFNLALLPYQKPAAIKAHRDDLSRKISDFEAEEYAGIIEKVEQESEQRIAAFEKRKRERLARRRELGKKPKRKKKRLRKTGREF